MNRHTDAPLSRIAQALTPRFDGTFCAAIVNHYVRDRFDPLDRSAVVKRYLPSLTERYARERLIALAQAQGLLVKTVPELSYVCSRNAGRSQIAAALTARQAAGRVHVRSAGATTAGPDRPRRGVGADRVRLRPLGRVPQAADR